MSTVITSKCWTLTGMTSTQKLVLITLADQAGDDGICWPGMARMVQRTCLSERAIRGALRWLEDAGLLSTSMRSGVSNSYKVTPENYRNEPTTQPNTPASGAATPAANAGDTPAANAPTPASGAGNPGTWCPQTVKNRKEPRAEADSSKIFQEPESEGRRKFAMTLDWQPTQMFSERAKPQGVNPDRLTPEILAAFVSHYEADGKQENQGQWENALVRWIKRERPSNVTPIRPGSIDEIMQNPNALTQPIYVHSPEWDEVNKNCVSPETFQKNITALRAMLEA